MFYMQTMFSEAGVRVDGFMGSHSPPGGLASTDVAICTIEKANSLVNRLLEEKKIGQLGIVVVDELHMIGDSHRGYLLELLLTKLRYVVATTLQPAEQDGDKQSNPIQVVGMSATLPNLDLLARWLEADLYRTEFRPVPLSEHVKIGKTLHDNSMALVREVEPRFEVKGDDDHIVTLCLETVSQGNGVLIFCPTKNWCEKLCETVAREIYRLHQGQLPTGNAGFTKASHMLPVRLDQRALRDVWEQLRRTPVSINPVLRKTVPYGVAYHHAGLTFDERDIIEGAFRQGFLKILVATSTLSSGVNLPARRVIIRSLMFNRKVIDPLTYKQMIGRAGRKGVDPEGESILVCKPSEREKASRLIKSQLPAVQSCLVKRSGDDLSNSLKRAILEVIASGVASSPAEVKAYASSTLLAASLTEGQETDDPESGLDTESAVLHCVKFLEENEFIRLQNVESGGETKERYCPTQLGRATLASALSPDEALRVFAELQTARKNFVLENELHILYQVTPIYDQGFQPDWYQFVCSWEGMSTDKRRVAELVGVEESFLMRASQGLVTSASRSAKVQKSIAVHRRFYTTLILSELVNEVPLPMVANRYNCATGQLQSLQQSASTFAGMVTVFCNRLGWWNLELLLAQFQSRLNFGVQRELCDLVRISLLNAQRARLLYDGGYQTVASLAASHPADVEMLLRNSVPFRSGRQAQGEAAFEAMERQQTRCIWATGRKGLTEAEAAELIISEARHIIQAELGVEGMAWQADDGTSSQRVEAGASVAGAREAGNTKSERRVDTPATEPSRETGRECHKLTVESVSTARESAEESSRSVSRDAASNASSPPTGQVQHKTNMENPERAVLPSKDDVVLSVRENQKRDSQSRHTAISGQAEGRCQDEKNESEAHELSVIQIHSQDKGMKGELPPVSGAADTTLKCRGMLNQPGKNQVLVAATVHPYPGACSSHSTRQSPRLVAKNALLTNIKPDAAAEQTNCVITCKSPPEGGTITGKASASIVPVKGGASEYTIATSERRKGHPSEETTPPSGQDGPREVNGSSGNKDTSPDLFSCPIEDEGLEEAMHAVTRKQKPGTSPLQEHAVNRGPGAHGDVGTSSPSEARENDKSPCFPSMDSQLEEFMAAYCTQNETIAQSASPDLSRSRKRILPATAGQSICDDKGRDSASASTKRDDGDSLSRNVYSKKISSRNEEQYDVPVADSSDPDNREVESTQDVLLAAAMCESFDSFSSSVLSSPINTKRNHKSGPPLPGTEEETSRPHVQLGHHAAMGITLNQGSGNAQCNPGRSAAATGNGNSDLFPPTLDDADRVFGGAENKDKHHPLDCTEVTVVRLLEGEESRCHRKSPADAQTRSRLSKKVKSSGHAEHRESILTAPTSCQGGSDRKDESSLLSPGTVAMLDFLAGDDDVDMFTQLKESPQGDGAESCSTQVPAGRDLNVTIVANHHSARKLGKRKKLPCSDGSSGFAGTAVSSNCLVSQGIMEERNSSTKTNLSVPVEKQGGKEDASTHVKETRKDSSVSRTSHTSKRKGGLDDISSPPKRHKTPPRDTPFYDKEDPAFLNSHQSKDKSDIPAERKASDSGDFIPPTPPKPTQGTPKLLRATGTTRRKSPRSGSKASSQHPKKSKASPSRPRLATGYTSLRISPRRRQGLQESAAAKDTVQPRTKYHVSATRAAPGKETRTIHQSTRQVDDAVKGGAVQTAPIQAVMPSMPCLESQMLHQECNDLFSQGTLDGQNDLNVAMDEFDLNLKLSVDSDVEMSPSQRAASPPPLLDSSSLPPATPSFTYPLSFSNTPSIPSSDGAFTIIDVCANMDLFRTFVSEWKRKKRYSISVSCEKYEPPAQQSGIGSNFKRPAANTKVVVPYPDGFPEEDLGLRVTGIAVCWGGKDAYFVSFQERIPEADPNDSLAQPTIAPGLTLRERLGQVRHVMEIGKLGRGARAQRQCKVVFGAKLQYKLLSRSCGCLLGGSLEDPKVAQWLIDPGSKEPNLQSLVTQYAPLEAHLLEDLGGGVGLRGPGASPEMQGSGRLRATTEAVLGLCLMDGMKMQLEELSLWKTFEEVEMPSIVTLARVELNGIGVDGVECETQKAIMQAKLGSLEEQAYRLASHCFSLTSPEDIAQVLYTELKLPPNGDATAAPAPGPPRRTLGARGRPRLAKHFSTSKEALEKLQPLHPLPGVILEFRRISAAVAKVVFPLQKEKEHHKRLKMDRVYTVYQTHTATGRVATFEPNIQAIPKEFDIHMPSVIEESPPGGGPLPNRQYASATACMRRGKHGRTKGGAYTPVTGAGSLAPKPPGPKFAVSIRQVFCPFPGGLMLAADYSQLELRLLAHLADDQALTAILNDGGDVFKQIAAKWRRMDIDSVTPMQRQQAKQICYGMVYGIGAKALGEQLGVCEEDAAAFMESFKGQYKGMKNYLLNVVKQCKEKGYVQTLSGRRRYLPSIHHTNPGARSQAERQAVNTTIQGSAADLVKTAMVKIDHRLAAEFPDTQRSHRHRLDEQLGLSPNRRKSRRLQTATTTATPSGAFLVLQLHDELIYEVRQEDIHQVAQLVKAEMEGALTLSVRLPVKVKVGPTWGTLEDMDL